MNKFELKLVWRVDPKPTGPYKSFEKRQWPSASYSNGSPAFSIACEEVYTPSVAKEGKHGALTIRVADHSEHNWRWKTIAQRAATLEEAKNIASRFLFRHPKVAPREVQNEAKAQK